MLIMMDDVWTWLAINWPICLIWLGGGMFVLTIVLIVIA